MKRYAYILTASKSFIYKGYSAIIRADTPEGHNGYFLMWQDDYYPHTMQRRWVARQTRIELSMLCSGIDFTVWSVDATSGYTVPPYKFIKKNP